MRKIILTAFFLVLLLVGLTVKIQAAGPFLTPLENGQALDNYIQNGEVTNPVHVFGVKDSDSYWFTCHGIGVGCPPASPAPGAPGGTNIYFQKSVIGQMSSGIAYLIENQPADTTQFIAYYGHKLGIVDKAYAQSTGIGFSGLRPLMNLWIAFRNIAYGFVIVIMVMVGFMIMFRAKIDPRTVISIQSAIPRIIITLFLITFSYAIVGLLIDLMYLSIFVILAVLTQAGNLNSNLVGTITNYTGGWIGYLWGSLWHSGRGAIDAIVNIITAPLDLTPIRDILTSQSETAEPFFLFPIITGAIGAIVDAGNSGAVEFVPSVLAYVLIGVALIFTFIRILVMLINAYIAIMISLIFGPLQIMLGAIPNSNAFGSWLKNLVANLAVFPITVLMFCLAAILTKVAATENLWTPPGLSGSGINVAISGLIGLGILFIIPTMAKTIKEALKSKPIIPMGTGALTQPITSVYGTGMSSIQQVYYLSSLKNMIPGLKH